MAVNINSKQMQMQMQMQTYIDEFILEKKINTCDEYLTNMSAIIHSTYSNFINNGIRFTIPDCLYAINYVNHKYRSIIHTGP